MQVGLEGYRWAGELQVELGCCRWEMVGLQVGQVWLLRILVTWDCINITIITIYL